MPLSTVGQAVGALALLGLVALHVLVAAVAVRFYRLRLETRWGPVLYTVLTVPVVYVATTLVVLGGLGLGSGLGIDRPTLVLALWGVPLSLGVSIDLFWAPQPDEVELPERS